MPWNMESDCGHQDKCPDSLQANWTRKKDFSLKFWEAKPFSKIALMNLESLKLSKALNNEVQFFFTHKNEKLNG